MSSLNQPLPSSRGLLSSIYLTIAEKTWQEVARCAGKALHLPAGRQGGTFKHLLTKLPGNLQSLPQVISNVSHKTSQRTALQRFGSTSGYRF